MKNIFSFKKFFLVISIMFNLFLFISPSPSYYILPDKIIKVKEKFNIQLYLECGSYKLFSNLKVLFMIYDRESDSKIDEGEILIPGQFSYKILHTFPLTLPESQYTQKNNYYKYIFKIIYICESTARHQYSNPEQYLLVFNPEGSGESIEEIVDFKHKTDYIVNYELDKFDFKKKNIEEKEKELVDIKAEIEALTGESRYLNSMINETAKEEKEAKEAKGRVLENFFYGNSTNYNNYNEDYNERFKKFEENSGDNGEEYFNNYNNFNYHHQGIVKRLAAVNEEFLQKSIKFNDFLNSTDCNSEKIDKNKNNNNNNIKEEEEEEEEKKKEKECLDKLTSFKKFSIEKFIENFPFKKDSNIIIDYSTDEEEEEEDKLYSLNKDGYSNEKKSVLNKEKLKKNTVVFSTLFNYIYSSYELYDKELFNSVSQYFSNTIDFGGEIIDGIKEEDKYNFSKGRVNNNNNNDNVDSFDNIRFDFINSLIFSYDNIIKTLKKVMVNEKPDELTGIINNNSVYSIKNSLNKLIKVFINDYIEKEEEKKLLINNNNDNNDNKDNNEEFNINIPQKNDIIITSNFFNRLESFSYQQFRLSSSLEKNEFTFKDKKTTFNNNKISESSVNNNNNDNNMITYTNDNLLYNNYNTSEKEEKEEKEEEKKEEKHYIELDYKILFNKDSQEVKDKKSINLILYKDYPLFSFNEKLFNNTYSSTIISLELADENEIKEEKKPEKSIENYNNQQNFLFQSPLHPSSINNNSKNNFNNTNNQSSYSFNKQKQQQQRRKLFNLSENFSLRIKQDSSEHTFCIFLNQSNLWSSEGCTSEIEEEGYVTCYCNHLTEFTLASFDPSAIVDDIIHVLDDTRVIDSFEEFKYISFGNAWVIYVSLIVVVFAVVLYYVDFKILNREVYYDDGNENGQEELMDESIDKSKIEMKSDHQIKPDDENHNSNYTNSNFNSFKSIKGSKSLKKEKKPNKVITLDDINNSDGSSVVLVLKFFPIYKMFSWAFLLSKLKFLSLQLSVIPIKQLKEEENKKIEKESAEKKDEGRVNIDNKEKLIDQETKENNNDNNNNINENFSYKKDSDFNFDKEKSKTMIGGKPTDYQNDILSNLNENIITDDANYNLNYKKTHKNTIYKLNNNNNLNSEQTIRKRNYTKIIYNKKFKGNNDSSHYNNNNNNINNNNNTFYDNDYEKSNDISILIGQKDENHLLTEFQKVEVQFKSLLSVFNLNSVDIQAEQADLDFKKNDEEEELDKNYIEKEDLNNKGFNRQTFHSSSNQSLAASTANNNNMVNVNKYDNRESNEESGKEGVVEFKCYDHISRNTDIFTRKSTAIDNNNNNNNNNIPDKLNNDVNNYNPNENPLKKTDSNNILTPNFQLTLQNIIRLTKIITRNTISFYSLLAEFHYRIKKFDLYIYFVFKILYTFYLSALFSPCNSKSGNGTFSYSGYAFSNRSLAVGILTFVVGFLVQFLVRYLLYKKKVDFSFDNKKINSQLWKYWVSHVIAYCIICVLLAFGFLNTLWISLKNEGIGRANTFYLDFLYILVIEFVLKQTIWLIIRIMIIFSLFRAGSFGKWEKFLLVLLFIL